MTDKKKEPDFVSFVGAIKEAIELMNKIDAVKETHKEKTTTDKEPLRACLTIKKHMVHGIYRDDVMDEIKIVFKEDAPWDGKGYPVWENTQ